METREEFDEAVKEGFTLFQGYYFCKPVLVRKSIVPSSQLLQLRLLNLLQQNSLDLNEISEVVEHEPSLAYRLLRFVNSAGCGIRQEVTSIEMALLVVGEEHFRRMATLAAAVELNTGSSPEIVRMALVRARFCEIVAPLCDLDPKEQCLLGLFSLLDAMLQMPMEEALRPLSLATPVRDALLGDNNDYRCPLLWIENHERGQFDRCDEIAISHGFVPDVLAHNFDAAILWVDELLAGK